MQSPNIRKHKNIFSFVRVALVNEAKRNGDEIFLDWKGHDFYYPSGSYLFKTSFPTYVDLLREGKYLDFSKDNDGCIHIIINQGLKEKSISDNGVVLGRLFIDELISRNKDAYLNYLFGQESEIESINRYNQERRNQNFDRESKNYQQESFELRFSNLENKFDIDELTPERISKENSELFKRYVKGYELDDNYKGAALILGNGVSIPFGADSWDRLVDNLLDVMVPYHIDDSKRIRNALSNSTYAMSSFAKGTLQRDELTALYNDTLYSSIYRKYHSLMAKEETLAKVIAEGKYKHMKMPIYTYNYDTFVEQQYTHDYHKDLFHRSSDEYTSGKDDIVIHLHGFVGYSTRKVKGIVLTDKEYFDAYLSNPSSTVRKAQEYVLSHYKCLFVGSSMSDLFQMSIIQDIAKKQGKDWCCFALMCFHGLSLNEKIQMLRYYREKGIYIILADDFKDMPSVLRELIT